MTLIDHVSIQGFRAARDVELRPGPLCALVGESSSGKSTVLSAIWALLEAAAPLPTGEDVSYGHTRVHVEAISGGRTLFLDAHPPSSLNLNREGSPPTLFFPAHLRSTSLLAPTDGRAKRAVGAVRAAHTDDGLTLVRSIGALVEARVRGLVILIEEPELYLSPPAQRHLHQLVRALSTRGRNQVFYSTHSPVFLAVDQLDELALVRHDERTGTTLVQPEALTERKAFRMLSEFDAERAEIFLARAVMLVEGRTEKIALPFVFRALGFDPDREAITIVDCGGKGNISLFAEICNACGIPYVVLHDRDAPRGQQPSEAEQIANEAILAVAGRARTVMLIPDFEGVAGLPARRGKPGAAFRRFQSGDAELPGPLRQAVERAVSAARRAPSSTRGA